MEMSFQEIYVNVPPQTLRGYHIHVIINLVNGYIALDRTQNYPLPTGKPEVRRARQCPARISV